MPGRRRQDGMVTAEFAVALPVLMLVLVLALSAVQAGINQVRCTDAARVGVRELARGETDQAARQAAAGVAPRGATIQLSRGGGTVTVTVVSDAPGMLGWVGVVAPQRATSVAIPERVAQP